MLLFIKPAAGNAKKGNAIFSLVFQGEKKTQDEMSTAILKYLPVCLNCC